MANLSLSHQQDVSEASLNGTHRHDANFLEGDLRQIRLDGLAKDDIH